MDGLKKDEKEVLGPAVWMGLEDPSNLFQIQEHVSEHAAFVILSETVRIQEHLSEHAVARRSCEIGLDLHWRLNGPSVTRVAG